MFGIYYLPNINLRGVCAACCVVPGVVGWSILYSIQVRSGFQVQCTGRISGRFDIHVAG
jgi:hypothetical protein